LNSVYDPTKEKPEYMTVGPKRIPNEKFANPYTNLSWALLKRYPAMGHIEAKRILTRPDILATEEYLGAIEKLAEEKKY
jgi:hypothetical protein